jgi:hypothetical protein
MRKQLQHSFTPAPGRSPHCQMVWLPALASGLQLCSQADAGLYVQHHATFVPLPSQLLGQVCSAVYTFVAANRPATAGVTALYPARSTCYRDYAHGGIRLVDIRSQLTALQAKIMAAYWSLSTFPGWLSWPSACTALGTAFLCRACPSSCMSGSWAAFCPCPPSFCIF